MDVLEPVVLELEKHAAEGGWDAPPHLYALVSGTELTRLEPELAARLEVPPDPDVIVPVEQEELPSSASMEEALAGIVWPDSVMGCALVLERLVLPPGVESEIPDDDDAAARWAAAHPGREDVRIVVGVLRDGSRYSVLRMRGHDSEESLLKGPELVDGLADLLATTLEPDEPAS